VKTGKRRERNKDIKGCKEESETETKEERKKTERQK
jgi:hypothetical protein